MLGKIMKKTLLIAGLSMLLLVAMAVPAMAGPWDVGIQAGDYFIYEAELVEWNVVSGEASFPDFFSGLTAAHNGSNWIRYTVTDITTGDGGDNVTFNVITSWADGDTTATVVDNMTSSRTLMVIGANMTAGEEIRPATTYMGSRTINETITRDYNNSITRDANVLDYTSAFGTSTYNYYRAWDVMTGMLVYSDFWGTIVNTYGTPYEVTYRGTMTLVDSSVEGLQIPDLTGPILLLTIMSISIPVALLHRRKKIVI
jgi:hypothetical protein